MGGLSRRELERLSYRQPQREISAEALGVLLALAYLAHSGAALPGREELTKLFLDRGDVPERLRNAIQFADRYDGSTLTTYTEMVDFAQQAGVLRRFNPGHVNTGTELGPLEAQHLLQMAATEFATEIDWLARLVASKGLESVSG